MRIAVLVTLIAALALGFGCGDDEESTTTTAAISETTTAPETTTSTVEQDEGGDAPEGGGVAAPSPGDDPEAVLEAFFTSGDPALVCGELATEKLLSSAYGDQKGCRQAQVPAATPDAIEIKQLDDSGDEAMATVVPDGGPNDGIETEVALVDEDGWRVDSLEADVPAGP